MADLAAIVLADSPLATTRLAGLTARERAVRVARRLGASSVVVVAEAEDRAQLAALAGAPALLVLRADQLVHPPLAQPALDTGRTALAIVPESPRALDLSLGAYAGALVARGADVRAVVERLVAGASDSEVATALADTAARAPHGSVARAPIATATDRAAAHRILYSILVKPQDNVITRYLYRPVSFPLTRALAWTPITPNQISMIVALLVVLGCWLTAHASHLAAFGGTATILAASYLDCCDGEIARLKLLSSRFGAWLDTVIDELSTIGYVAALGWHCHLAYGPDYLGHVGFDPWVAGIVLDVVTYSASIYIVYYNIIVAVGSANSQDYAASFTIEPGTRADTRRLVPVPPRVATSWFGKYAPYVVRRDFISWGVTVLAALTLTQLSFILQTAAGVLTIVVLGGDHVRLRALRRRVADDGHVLEPPSR